MYELFRISLLLTCIILATTDGSAQKVQWTLRQCIDSAIINSLTIQQSVNTIELNRIAVKQSKNNLLPAINGSLGQYLDLGRTVNPVTGLYENGTIWSTSGGISLSQNLFNGLQLLNTIKQNDLTYQSSKYDLADAKFNLTIGIINGFLQVLYTHEALNISKRQVSADSVQLQTTLDMEFVGKKTESDVLQIKSQLSTDKYTLVNDISLWKLSKVSLQQLINLAVTDSFEIDYSTSLVPKESIPDAIVNVYAQSLSFQPIIKSYALKTESQQYALRVARGAYYPHLMLNGNIQTDYSSEGVQSSTTTSNNLQTIGYVQSNPTEIVVSNLPQQIITERKNPFGNQLSQNINGTISVTLAIPILNYLQVGNNVKKQRVNLGNAVLSEEVIKVNLRKTIEQIYTNVLNSEAQYSAANEEVDANKAAYDVAVIKYKQGKMIASDLIVQLNAYIKAESDQLQAKYGLLFNTQIMDYYQGIPITF